MNQKMNSPYNINRALGPLLFLAILALSVVGCQQGDSANEVAGGGAMGLPVIQIKAGEATVSKQYAGSIEGVVNVEIRPQVSGYLQKIHVDEGAFVRAGQVLFKIDDRTYAEQHNNAQAALLAAKANLSSAKIEVDKRVTLVEKKIVSDIQLTQAKASYEAAEAAVAQAASAVQTAKINLDFSTIKAPVSGYIGGIPFRLGSLVSPNQAAALTTLSDVHEVYVYFSMSENDFVAFQNQYTGKTIEEKLKNVPPVKLLLADGSEYPVPGRLNAVEGQFDRNTGSISVRAVFNNENGLLRSGNTGKIVIEQTVAQTTLLPIASTISVQNKIYAFVLDKDSKAIQTPVEVSGKSGANYMVTSGVKPGDKVVASGFDRLQSGTSVKPKAAETETKP